jgi:hypothetical protein
MPVSLDMGVGATTYLLEVWDGRFEGESNEERAHELLRRAVGLGRLVRYRDWAVGGVIVGVKERGGCLRR